MARIVEEFKEVIVSSNLRKKERAERRHIEDFDDEEGELLREENEQEQEILEQVLFLNCVTAREVSCREHLILCTYLWKP